MASHNLPDRSTLYVLQDGERGLEIIDDTRLPNTSTFRIVKQDHTLANLLRAQLLEDKNIVFAGYKVPHPLEPYFLLKVQTNGTVTPSQALKNACISVISTVTQLEKKFLEQFRERELGDGIGGVGAAGGMGGVYGGTDAWGDGYADF